MGRTGKILVAMKASSRVSLEGPAQDPLRAAEGVGLGRVEEGDPDLEGLVDDLGRVVLGVVPAVAPLP